MIRLALELVLALFTVCGLAFYLIALWSAHLFRRMTGMGGSSAFSPPVSILKPLKDIDDQTYAALRSHCVQEYGSYEIIFGVNDGSDPAIPLVQRLASEFPHADIRLVVCSEIFGANRKASNLVQMLREAKHECILVNDGDIKVSSYYLQSVMSHFEHPTVGMVTCLYRARPSRTLGSRLEALGIATDFAPGVLTASYLEDGLHFSLGSTLAMSRSALDKIGGFEAVLDYIADDYQLGLRISAAGFKVELAPEIVETCVPPYSFRQFWEHQLRWARTMRDSRPGGYRGLVLTYALPWAILLTVFAPHLWWAWTLLVATLAARIAVALSVGRLTLHDANVLRDLWLLPLRDVLALAIWIWSYADDTVIWRGEKFRLEKGRMYAVAANSSDTAATPAIGQSGSGTQPR
jgi:ceramide glucosyltransferase